MSQRLLQTSPTYRAVSICVSANTKLSFHSFFNFTKGKIKGSYQEKDTLCIALTLNKNKWNSATTKKANSLVDLKQAVHMKLAASLLLFSYRYYWTALINTRNCTGNIL